MNTLWQAFERVALGQPGAAALIQGGTTVTFGELRHMALGAAVELIRRNFRAGDRCLLWGRNSPGFAAAMLASWRQGGIIVLVNSDAPHSHLADAATRTAPMIAVVDAALAQAASAVLDCPILAIQELTRAVRDVCPADTHDEQAASILFTSGSTGLPKGVTQSQANLLSGSARVAAHLGLRREDRILCPIPWSFDYGFGQLLSTVLLGIPQVLPEAPNPFAICEAIASHRPTVMAGLPSVFALLIRGVSPVHETDLSSLRLVTNTGGKIAPSIFQDLTRIFGHCEISLNYGLTETYRTAGLPVALARKHPESVGVAYPGVAVAVLREDGTEADPGESGEIVHRGAGTFLGYWGDAASTAAVRRPDPLWPHPGLAPAMAVFTGDLGWKDGNGLLHVKGRRDRQIKSMGVRVSPDEIETIIRRSGLVRDVAVVGIPHDFVGDMVAAALTVEPGTGDPVRALQALARKEMSEPMRPRLYRIVDALPLTPNGKPDLFAVRTLLAHTLTGAPR